MENRKELLKQIKDEVMVLKSSPLYAERTKNKVFPVIGEGDHFAKIMFVGEAPGRTKRRRDDHFAVRQERFSMSFSLQSLLIAKVVYIQILLKTDRPLTAIHFQMRSRAMAISRPSNLKLYSPR